MNKRYTVTVTKLTLAMLSNCVGLDMALLANSQSYAGRCLRRLSRQLDKAYRELEKREAGDSDGN